MTSDRPVRIGVAGAGHRGGTYVDQILRLPGAKLTALCDTLPHRMELFRQRWNLNGVLCTTSLDQMLEGDKVDAVIITVPDRYHREVAVKCFQAGKDVMLEKPLAPSTADCRAIIDAHKASGRLLQVGFVLRCTPFYRRIKRIIDSGRLGQMMFVHACEYLSVEHGTSFMTRWHRKKENAGTILLCKNSHDLDLLNWLIGSLPTHVASFGGTDFFRPERAGARTCSECDRINTCRFRSNGDWYFLHGEKPTPGRDICAFNDDKDVVDNQVVILQYANRVRATFEMQMFYPERSTRFITIGGDQAYLHGCLETGRITLKSSVDNTVEEIDASADNDSGHGGGDLEFAQAFIDAVRTRRGTVAGIEAGLACNVIAEAAETARLEMRVVQIDPKQYEC